MPRDHDWKEDSGVEYADVDAEGGGVESQAISEFSTQFVPRETDPDELWEVIAITAERAHTYRVRWAGIDPQTGEEWEQSWVPKHDCTTDLVEEWKRSKARRSAGRRSSTKAKSRSSISKATTAVKRSSSSRNAVSTRQRTGSTISLTSGSHPPDEPEASTSKSRIASTSTTAQSAKSKLRVEVSLPPPPRSRASKRPRSPSLVSDQDIDQLEEGHSDAERSVRDRERTRKRRKIEVEAVAKEDDDSDVQFISPSPRPPPAASKKQKLDKGKGKARPVEEDSGSEYEPTQVQLKPLPKPRPKGKGKATAKSIYVPPGEEDEEQDSVPVRIGPPPRGAKKSLGSKGKGKGKAPARPTASTSKGAKAKSKSWEASVPPTRPRESTSGLSKPLPKSRFAPAPAPAPVFEPDRHAKRLPPKTKTKAIEKTRELDPIVLREEEEENTQEAMGFYNAEPQVDVDLDLDPDEGVDLFEGEQMGGYEYEHENEHEHEHDVEAPEADEEDHGQGVEVAEMDMGPPLRKPRTTVGTRHAFDLASPSIEEDEDGAQAEVLDNSMLTVPETQEVTPLSSPSKSIDPITPPEKTVNENGVGSSQGPGSVKSRMKRRQQLSVSKNRNDASNSGSNTPVRKQKKLGPVPTLSPSVFKPHLPKNHDKLIRQALGEESDEGESEEVEALVSSIEQFSSQEDNAKRGKARAKERRVDTTLFLKMADGEKEERRPKKRKLVADIVRETLAKRNGDVASLPAIDPSSAAVPGEEGETETIVQDMEDAYVDYDNQDSHGGPASNLNAKVTTVTQEEDMEELPATASSKQATVGTDSLHHDHATTQEEATSHDHEREQELHQQISDALQLLHTKSEEIRRLEAQLASTKKELAEVRTEEQAKAEVKAKQLTEVWSETRQRLTDERASDREEWEKREKEAEEAQRAEWKRREEEWAAEKARLEQEKNEAERDRELFREQYGNASTFASTVQMENVELKKRTEILESQLASGLQLVKSTYTGRIGSLQKEVEKHKAVADILEKREARLKSEEVTMKVAEWQERGREIGNLQQRLRAIDRENAHLREELAIAMLREERLRGSEKVSEQQRHEQPISADEERFGSDDDGEWVPDEGDDPSWSDDSDDSTDGSAYEDEADVRIPPPRTEDAERRERDHGEELVFMCKWSPEGDSNRCTALLSTKEELLEHFMSAHAAKA